VPHTPASEGMIGARQFELMKQDVYFINISRGKIVDTAALVAAPESGKVRAAGLDVTDPEPIPMDDPLLSPTNCLIVPHIGSASLATRTRMASLAAENIVAFLAGQTPPTPVNPEVLTPSQD